MTDSKTSRRQRRTARPKQDKPAPAAKAPSRLEQLEQLLVRESGASIVEMVGETGWQQHSVRGAMAGALKKRGLTITSEKVEGIRRYRGERPA